LLVTLAVLLTSCATQYYALDGDYNGKKADVELTEDELVVQRYFIDQARVLESFSDAALEEGFQEVGGRGQVVDGAYLIRGDESQGLEVLRYSGNQEFTSVTVCWDIDSSQGHLIMWVTVPGFGRPTFFNNPGATSAHIHLDSLNGDTEFLGHNEDNLRGYLVQEVRVEGDEIVLRVNGSEFSRYPMDRQGTLTEFQIGTNDGATGAIDWIAVR
jgi:hypothetical protein